MSFVVDCGQLVFGIEDGTRHVVGVAEPLDLEERIANLVADAVEPRLLPEIEIVPWRKTHVVVVTVHPSALRPHHVVAEGPERGTYVRLGSTNRMADAALVAELARRTGAEGFGRPSRSWSATRGWGCRWDASNGSTCRPYRLPLCARRW